MQVQEHIKGKIYLVIIELSIRVSRAYMGWLATGWLKNGPGQAIPFLKRVDKQRAQPSLMLARQPTFNFLKINLTFFYSFFAVNFTFYP